MYWLAYTRYAIELPCGCREVKNCPVYDASGNFPAKFKTEEAAIAAAQEQMKACKHNSCQVRKVEN